MLIKAHVAEQYYTVLIEETGSIIKDIALYHEGEREWTDLVVQIDMEDGVFSFDPVYIQALPGFTNYTITQINQYVRYSSLRTLSEKQQLLVTVTVVQEGQTVASYKQTVTLHPLDSFPGMEHVSSLARYVIPNYEYIIRLKQQTVRFLEKYKFQTTLEGYLSGSKQRVMEIIASLFYALKNEKWMYSALPPSYEQKGQRIRLIDQIEKQRFGNCIDFSLAISACLEAMGLNPIIILIPGHAFVGCWLIDDRFEQAVIHHKGDVTNRIAKGMQEIVVWEATAVCAGSELNFKKAVAEAEKMIVGEQVFQCALDIKTARIVNLLPLNLQPDTKGTSEAAVFQIKGKESGEEFITVAESPSIDIQQLNNAVQHNKQRVWERKLLDLTLRNSLLNLRLSNNTIQLVNVDFNILLDKLLDNKALTIGNTKALDLYLNKKTFISTLHETDGLRAYAAAELLQNRLLNLYSDTDMVQVLTHIMRNNNLAMDETGANSLYLTIGALKWCDPKTPDIQRIAPLIMIPVYIRRQSILSRFTIRFREEELQINATLIEFLNQEFQLNLSGLLKYMEETELIDIQQVLNTVRTAIRAHKGWEVDELLFLSNFNFSTQVLWQDIHQNMPHLMNHPIVKGLVQNTFQTDLSLQLPETIDTRNIDIQKHIFPIDADSSQTEAIMTANMDKSFVLHGPPGTGKSQTITNIIANYLFHGKTVLFVAAKKAALDVVHKRLENIGLDKFTLELHSNKTKKNEVLEHLEKSVGQLKLVQDDAFEKTARKVSASIKEIEQIQKAVHQKTAVGYSVYELIQTSIKIRKEDDGVAIEAYDFPNEILLSLHQQQLDNWKKWITELAHNSLFKSNYVRHPLHNISEIKYFIGLETFVNNFNSKSFAILKNSLNKLSQLIEKEINNKFENYNQLIELADTIRDNAAIPIKLLTKAFVYQYDNYLSLLNLYKQSKKIENQINKDFHLEVFKVNAETLKIEYLKADKQWFIPKFFNKRKIKKTINVYNRINAINDVELLSLLDRVMEYKNLNNTLNINSNKKIINELSLLLEMNNADDILQEYRKKIEQINTLSAHLGLTELISSRVDTLSSEAPITAVFTEEMWQLLDNIKTESLQLQPDIAQFNHTFSFVVPPETIDEYLSATALLSANSSLISDWSDFRNRLRQGEKLGLKSYLAYVEEQAVDKEHLSQHFEWSVYSSLLRFYIQNNPLLRNFDGQKLDGLLETYHGLQHNFTEYTKKELYIRLLQRLPSTNFANIDNSELSVLLRTIKSRGRGVSIRQLISKTQNILPRITPCMLMSPISVAQYLDIEIPKFDVVIFDEASQLPTSEAISAMARARQVIIVGDPKQMPPTAFFSAQKPDEDNLDLEDLESILDDALSINVPSKYLLRHYRSQHESLITFSNRSFYDNALFTFPSADDQVSKVQLIPVGGYYDKGATRQNLAEANAVVNEVLRRLQSPTLRKKTIGIVTFSQPQQSLIADLLDEAYARRPDLEVIMQQMSEPVFIKNLENVQGDERDVILFSIGYGPDKEGRVSMNFGPLNREGGWRRLNVAVTRAKYEMMVFASLQPEMIDLGKTQAKGVVVLKSFLEFARMQNTGKEETLSKQSNDVVLQDIMSFIKGRGYEVSCEIGQSHFKIDLAVANPQKPEQFLLGIVVDNENYYDAGNVNDRVHIIPKVLHHLGWNVISIWALDWQFKQAVIQKQLLETLRMLEADATAKVMASAPEVIHDSYTFNSERLQDSAIQEGFVQDEQLKKDYQATVLPKTRFTGADVFLSAQYRELVKNQMLKIVMTEAPVNIKVLQKRLLEAWSITRAGARIERYVHDIAGELQLPYTAFEGETFIWKSGQQPGELEYYRCMPADDKRQVTELTPEEIFVCLKEVLLHHIQLEQEQAWKYLQKTLLNSRYHAGNNAYLEKAVMEANVTREVSIRDGYYLWVQ